FVGTMAAQRSTVRRLDAFGTTPVELLSDNKSSILDPDYSPTANKIVYISTQSSDPARSGNYEVWIADPSGANPHQVTVGFGDTARGVFARRPRFSPNGQMIVFESNVADG